MQGRSDHGELKRSRRAEAITENRSDHGGPKSSQGDEPTSVRTSVETYAHPILTCCRPWGPAGVLQPLYQFESTTLRTEQPLPQPEQPAVELVDVVYPADPGVVAEQRSLEPSHPR